jgi:hypothetical protein
VLLLCPNRKIQTGINFNMRIVSSDLDNTDPIIHSPHKPRGEMFSIMEMSIEVLSLFIVHLRSYSSDLQQSAMSLLNYHYWWGTLATII